jgi:protease-4
MALNADTLLDRIYLKAQITKWRMLAIVIAALCVIISIESVTKTSPIEKEFIARLSFDGIIGDDQAIYDLIDDVAENRKAKAVILWLDTPGGSAVGGEETYLRLRELAKKKPVVAVMRSVAASAGYMVALGADRIIAREGTITGSIGVIIESAEVTELAKKLGVEPIIIKSSPLKASPSPFEKTSSEAEKAIREVIMDFYDRFVDMVAERRNLTRKDTLAIADGRVYSGRKALALKLIDGIGGEDEALKWLEEVKKIRPGLAIKDVQVEQPNDFFSSLSQSLAGNFFQKSRVGLDGISAIWHPDLH